MASDDHWADEVMYLTVYGMVGGLFLILTHDIIIASCAMLLAAIMSPYAAYHTVRFLLTPMRWFGRKVKKYRLGSTTVTKRG